MFNFKINIPEIDKETDVLFKASKILESLGNDPDQTTVAQFQDQLALSAIPVEQFELVTLAAISIETMMNYDLARPMDTSIEPTIH